MCTAERRGDNQKQKMLVLARIFKEESDPDHRLSMRQIIAKLATHGIKANRKTLYQDFRELTDYGIEIEKYQEGREHSYYVANRDFELVELKLLVDAVQSAKFIDEDKSKRLVEKLGKLGSIHEAGQLKRQVIMTGRVKTQNHQVYYNVDAIHSALLTDQQIKFQYFQWNIKKEMELRHDGAFYQVSPWALMWSEENYYLVGTDQEDKVLKHFRVDKMRKIKRLSENRDGSNPLKDELITRYKKSLFGMYGGEATHVELLFQKGLAGVLIDRFGLDISFYKTENPEYFRTFVDVAISRQFLGWIMALGDRIKIMGPYSVIERMQSEIQRLGEQYLP